MLCKWSISAWELGRVWRLLNALVEDDCCCCCFFRKLGGSARICATTDQVSPGRRKSRVVEPRRWRIVQVREGVRVRVRLVRKPGSVCGGPNALERRLDEGSSA
jgi:hypothetical protein